ncbi:MAG: ATP-dependent endonuclease [Anaerolineales bacterium]|nr:ATP-dependent endonuclease [Anaerolineales bacterium]
MDQNKSEKDTPNREELAQQTLAGYAHGPDAPLQAEAQALARLDEARAALLVEGISDQIALETLAARQGRDLAEEKILVVPIGGAQSILRYLRLLGPEGRNIPVAGLCDANEERIFRRGLARAGLGSPQNREELAGLGFFVCDADLESELIRALGPAQIETLFAAQGDLGSFRTLQNQPNWRSRPVSAQMRRFLGSGARRKLRYARLLVEALPLEAVPRPLTAVLSFV